MSKDQRPKQAIGLIWGMKQSFRSYVEMTGGTIETVNGAERVPDGAFAFAAIPGEALAPDESGNPHGRGSFVGEVRFQSHGGMLSVRLADPIVEITAAGASLTIIGDEPPRRLEIAQLDLSAMTAGEADEILIPTALSMEGCQLLDNQYPSGTALDPIHLIFAPLEG